MLVYISGIQSSPHLHKQGENATTNLVVQTGESMWEKDLLSQAQALREEVNEEEPTPQLAQWLRQQTQRARLIAFLGRHDPLKLMQV